MIETDSGRAHRVEIYWVVRSKRLDFEILRRKVFGSDRLNQGGLSPLQRLLAFETYFRPTVSPRSGFVAYLDGKPLCVKDFDQEYIDAAKERALCRVLEQVDFSEALAC